MELWLHVTHSGQLVVYAEHCVSYMSWCGVFQSWRRRRQRNAEFWVSRSGKLCTTHVYRRNCLKTFVSRSRWTRWWRCELWMMSGVCRCMFVCSKAQVSRGTFTRNWISRTWLRKLVSFASGTRSIPSILFTEQLLCSCWHSWCFNWFLPSHLLSQE